MDFKQWIDKIQQLPWAKQWRLLASICFIIIGFASLGFWAYQPDYSPLFSNLAEKESGAVISALEQSGVPYKLSANGTILIDRSKIYEVKYRLASQGIPKHQNQEASIEPPQFGSTSQQDLAYQQKLKEKELAFSIMSIAGIGSARVHLALPKQTIFGKETTSPSASVVIDPQYPLSRAQSSAIAKLVSGSIPGMTPDKVSIIDSSGRLLEAQSDLSASTPEQKQMISEIRADYTNRIQRLLESIVGPGSVRAEVDVDMEFGNQESVVETWKPNSGDAAIRSAKISEKRNGVLSSGGIPGSPTNFPPSKLPPLPGTPSNPSTLAAAQPSSKTDSNGQLESVINYEVDRSVVKSTNQIHRIKKINAAVLIDLKKTKGKDGVITTSAFTPEELSQFQSLVRETIGFTPDRGDSVQVLSMPFALNEPVKETLSPLDNPYYINLLPMVLKIFIAFILGLLLLKQLQKLIITLKEDPAPPPEVKPDQDSKSDSPSESTAQSQNIISDTQGQTQHGTSQKMDLNAIKQLAQSNPQAVAALINDWVDGDADE